MYNREDFVSNSDWKKFMEFSKDLETPNIVVNVNTVRRNFIKLRDSFPYAHIYYAMKANPGEPILKMLIEEGVKLDEPCDGHWKEIREAEGSYAIGVSDAIKFVPKKKK